MPKVSVYLPDDLHSEVRRRSLPLSQLAQDAIRAAIDAEDNAAWVARMRRRVAEAEPSPATTSTEDLMEAVADEFAT